MINTSIVLPIVMSFGSIIYRDDFFRPYLSGLIQLTIVSGAVHQISFSTFSTLPFAVGSVQDAGEKTVYFSKGVIYIYIGCSRAVIFVPIFILAP